MTRQASNHLLRGMVAVMALSFIACSSGYRIHKADGVETFYHVGKDGKRIVYVIQRNGALEIHDENDPVIRQFFATTRLDWHATPRPQAITEEGWDTAKLVRIGRITAAAKRRASDPILVAVHDAEVGAELARMAGTAEKAERRFQKYVTETMTGDGIIRVTSQPADVEVYLRGYFKATPALNVETHKLVTVPAFHFEAYVQSNYLPGDSHTIVELGHWMKNREVIERAMQRVNKVIKERIGPNIPKDRSKFLSLNLKST